MDFKNIILTIIIIILGLGVYGIIGLLIYKLIKRKQKKINEILANPLKKEEAQRLLNKREKHSNNAFHFIMWYYPVLGLICISLGFVPIYFEMEKLNEDVIIGEIIKGVLAIILGLYFLINGSIRLYKY